MDQVNVGIIGAGGMGAGLAKAVAANGSAKVTWVCDVNQSNAQALADQVGGQVSDSWDPIFADPDVTGVIVATPHHLHDGPTIEAANAGKHVFVEKPMALSSAACQRMIDAARSAGTKLMVGQVLRYIEPYATLWAVATSGEYGKPVAAVVWRSGLGWGLTQDWRRQSDTHGGILFEVAVHELDLIQCILGPICNVMAVGGQFAPKDHDVEDLTLLNVRFRDGGFGHFQHGVGDPEGKTMMKVWCDKALLACEGNAKEPIRVSPLDGGDRLEAPMQFNRNGVEHEINLWIEAILQDKAVPIPGEAGMHNIRVVEAAKQSMRTGQAVDV
jgi:phthalate 4,5-cis-dihydrodiol dehydrogenase